VDTIHGQTAVELRRHMCMCMHMHAPGGLLRPGVLGLGGLAPVTCLLAPLLAPTLAPAGQPPHLGGEIGGAGGEQHVVSAAGSGHGDLG
jgi:hypothetical protein